MYVAVSRSVLLLSWVFVSDKFWVTESIFEIVAVRAATVTLKDRVSFCDKVASLSEKVSVSDTLIVVEMEKVRQVVTEWLQLISLVRCVRVPLAVRADDAEAVDSPERREIVLLYENVGL